MLFIKINSVSRRIALEQEFTTTTSRSYNELMKSTDELMKRADELMLKTGSVMLDMNDNCSSEQPYLENCSSEQPHLEEERKKQIIG